MKVVLLAVVFAANLAATAQQAATATNLEAVVGDQHLLLAEALRSMPHTTLTVTNGHTGASETYSGIPLIDLLAKEGVPHGKDLHGKAFSEYVVATGVDGYKAVLALAAVDPEFHRGTVIVADTLAGKPLDGKTGPYKLVVSEDKRPARSVHLLLKLEVNRQSKGQTPYAGGATFGGVDRSSGNSIYPGVLPGGDALVRRRRSQHAPKWPLPAQWVSLLLSRFPASSTLHRHAPWSFYPSRSSAATA